MPPQEIDVALLGSTLPPIPDRCQHADCEGTCWKNYPSSRFPNWTSSQVKRSQIQKVIGDPSRFDNVCKIYAADVDTKGYFSNVGDLTVKTEEDANEFWQKVVHEKVFIFSSPRAYSCGAHCHLLAAGQPAGTSAVCGKYDGPSSADLGCPVSDPTLISTVADTLDSKIQYRALLLFVFPLLDTDKVSGGGPANERGP